MKFINGFVLIKAGTFTMGSPEHEKGRSSDEILHEVTITRDFELQVTPVTQLQWALVMGENPSYFVYGQDAILVNVNGNNLVMNTNCPVENVSWDDAQKFIKKLNDLDGGYIYRLPTEAEWEMAARAGTTTAYSHGDNVEQIGEYAWLNENSENHTHEVAKLKPNPSGLFDMHGNVWEWCQDIYGPYQAGPVTDPVGASSCLYRVLRGGCWGVIPMYLRSAQRGYYSPGSRYGSIGFRLCRTKI